MKPILYQHGPLIGQVAPARIATVKRRTSLSLARKPVFGSISSSRAGGAAKRSSISMTPPAGNGSPIR